MSFSFAETIMHGLFFVALGLLFPVLLPAYPYALAFMMLISVWGHCGMELLPLGWRRTLWGQFMNSATNHDFHHQGAVNKNFGQYFLIWDRLMGTYAEPEWPPERAHAKNRPASPVAAE